MSRHSTNADQRLIRAARELVPETGFSRLTLREVAAKAGVNLGMFNYHFKDKRNFLCRVMEEMYEEFLAKFNWEVAVGETSLEQLRNALRALGRFVRDNRRLLTALGRDVMEGDRDIVRFVEDNFSRHMTVIYKIVQQCRKEGYLAPAIPVPQVLVFLAASVAGPSIMFNVVDRAPTGLALTALKKTLSPMVIGDKALDKRVDMAIQAVLKPKPAAALAGARRKTRAAGKKGNLS